MKKRLWAWGLAVCIALSLFPVTVLAETSAPKIVINENREITVDGVSYRLVLGERIIGNGITKYSGESYVEFIDDPEDKISFESDILLLDENFQNEAPESVYQAFWASCDITIDKNELSNVTVSEIQTREDGYHKFISCSIIGEASGTLFAAASQDNNPSTMGWKRTFSIGKATELDLDEDGQACFTITDAQKNAVYAFCVDLGSERVAEVSATLTNKNVYGKVALENGKFLWRYFEGDTESKEYSYSVSAQKIMFLVYPFAFTGEATTVDITGTISVDVEQPELMYRLMKNSKGTWTERTDAPQPINSLSFLSVGLNTQSGIRFYYGTTSDYTLVSDAVLTSSDSSIASVSTEIGADGENFFLINGLKYAPTTLTLSAKGTQHTITASVSPVRGFYSTQERTVDSYLTSVTWENLSLDKKSGKRILWFTGMNGFGGDQSHLSVTVNGETGTYEWVERGKTSIYDLEIFLPDPKGVSYEVSIMYTSNENTRTYSTISVECPGLMFRYMDYNRDTEKWTERTDNLQIINNLTSVELNNSKCVRFYYGTSAEAVAVDSVSSDDSSMVAVTSEIAADNKPFYRLSGKNFGETSVTCTTRDLTRSFNVTVGLPFYGFYSSKQPSAETYLNKIALTGTETDLTEVWFVGKKAFVDDTVTVMAGDTDITKTKVNKVDDRTLQITLPSDMTALYTLSVMRGSSRLRGINVTLPSSGGNQTGGEVWQGDYAAYIDDYVIGFAEKLADGEVTKICENADKVFGHGTFDNGAANPFYQKEAEFSIAAATKSKDSEGATTYKVNPEITSSVEIKRLWIEHISGDSTTFSWSGNALVTELTSVREQSVALYVKEGRNCEATVCAQIAVTVNGTTYEKNVRTNIGLTIINGGSLNRPDNDTTEDLNAFLKELAGALNTADQKNELYHIKLGNTTYEGTIEVPGAFVRPYACLHFDGAVQNGKKTVIKGSLDINGANIERIKNIHFIADESSLEQTKAIFGGGLRDVVDCSFYGYDIALDSSDGLINASESVFVNNEIAAAVKINNSMDDYDVLPSDWNNNTFINNGSAVQILSLSKQVSPYYFRIYDSNFINNGTDIDARCGGTLYMYRNYFGQYRIDKDGHRPHPGKHHHDRHNGRDYLRLDELLNARTESKLNGLLDYTRAKISTKNGTKVIINPRWLHPVKDWWGHNALINDTFFGPEQTTNDIMTLDVEPEYKDILVADWENETVILNEESSTLTLDASTFEGTKKKEIGIVDGEESEYLGTWIFD